MARMRWDKVEQDRRISKYGTARVEPSSSAAGKKAKKAKKKRKRQKKTTPSPAGATKRSHFFRTPDVADPAERIRRRTAEFQRELARLQREIRKLEKALSQKRNEARGVEERIARLERLNHNSQAGDEHVEPALPVTRRAGPRKLYLVQKG